TVPFVILLSAGYLSAFLITVHDEVTRKGLADLQKTSLVHGREFTAGAILEIVNADMSMDTKDCSNDQSSDLFPAIPCGVPSDINSQPFLIGELFSGMVSSEASNPSFHFDNEQLLDGNMKIKHARDAAVAHLKNGNYTGARKRVGLALHTIQDFYAHSNWIDVGLRCCLTRLGFDNPDPFHDPYELAGPKEGTCDPNNPSTL